MKSDVKVVVTSMIIQIGYDLLSGDKSLEELFDLELMKRNIPPAEKPKILEKIRQDFNLPSWSNNEIEIK